MRNRAAIFVAVLALWAVTMSGFATAHDLPSGVGVTGTSDGQNTLGIQARVPGDSAAEPEQAKSPAVPPVKKVTLRPSCSYLDIGPDGKTVDHCQMRKCADGKDQYLRVTEQGGTTDLQLVCGLPDSAPGS
ncbi:MAG TPA: hypothetical protein VHU91_08220, partial [Mycobacteriales bacterium]|nr:hypothetical protein [Mycobacteriales bacterium]